MDGLEELSAPEQNKEGLMKMTAGLKVKCLYLTSVPSGVESYMCFSHSLLSVIFYKTNSVSICLLSHGASTVEGEISVFLKNVSECKTVPTLYVS